MTAGRSSLHTLFFSIALGSVTSLPAGAAEPTAVERAEADLSQAYRELDEVQGQMREAQGRQDRLERAQRARESAARARRDLDQHKGDASERLGGAYAKREREASTELRDAIEDLERHGDKNPKETVNDDYLKKNRKDAGDRLRDLRDREQRASRKADEARRKTEEARWGASAERAPPGGGASTPVSRTSLTLAVTGALEQGRLALADIQTAIDRCDRSLLEAAKAKMQAALQELAAIADRGLLGPHTAGLQGVGAAAHAALNEIARRWKNLEALWEARCGGRNACAPPGGGAIASAPPQPPPGPGGPQPPPGSGGPQPPAGSGGPQPPSGSGGPRPGTGGPQAGETPDVLAASCTPPASSPAGLGATPALNALDQRAASLQREDAGQLKDAGVIYATPTGWQTLAITDIYMTGAYLQQLGEIYRLRYGAVPPQFAPGNLAQANAALVGILDEIRWLKTFNPQIMDSFGMGTGIPRTVTGWVRGYFRRHAGNVALYGDTVLLHSLDGGAPQAYNLVSPDQSDHQQKLSSNDTLGRNLLGRQDGEQVTIDGRPYRVEITTRRLSAGDHDAIATARLTTLQAQLDGLLNVPNPAAAPPSQLQAALDAGRTTLHRQAGIIQTLTARLEAARQARDTGKATMQRQLTERAVEGGGTPEERAAWRQEAQDKGAALDAAVDAALRDLNQAFQGFSILRVEVGGQPLWQALNALGPNQSGQDLILKALEQQAQTTRDQIVWWGVDATPKDKVSLLGSQPFSTVRSQIGGDPQLQAGLPSCTLTRGFGIIQGAAESLAAEQDVRDLERAGVLMLAALPVLFWSPELGIAGGWVADRALGAAAIITEGQAYTSRATQAETLQREAVIGVIAQADLGESNRPPSAGALVTTVVAEVVSAIAPFALPPILQKLEATQIARAARAAVTAEAAARAEEAGRRAARAAAAAGAAAESGASAARASEAVTSVAPGGILNRIDPSLFTRPKLLGNPGDDAAAFFAANGLAPRRTVEIGGQTFHLSDPFVGPAKRVGVVAFQETTDGTVIPRTFYLSNEHGVWRAATSRIPGRIEKGPTLPDGHFVNETAADLASDFQGLLNRWYGERGALELSKDASSRAFFDHVDWFNQEYKLFVSGADVSLALPPGAQPDFAAGPLDTWTFNSPLYGRVDGFLYGSTDGSVHYTVLRDQSGRVWVPSVHDPEAGLTPFGTRWEVYKTDQTTTPMMHNPDYDPDLPISDTNRPYIDNPNYRNPLNDLFAQNLPRSQPPGAGPTAAGTPARTAGAPTAGGPAPVTGSGASLAGGAHGLTSAVRTGTPSGSSEAAFRLGRLPGYVVRLASGASAGPFSFITAHAPYCFSYVGWPIVLPWGAGGGYLLPVDTTNPGSFGDALGQGQEFGYIEKVKTIGGQFGPLGTPEVAIPVAR